MYAKNVGDRALRRYRRHRSGRGEAHETAGKGRASQTSCTSTCALRPFPSPSHFQASWTHLRQAIVVNIVVAVDTTTPHPPARDPDTDLRIRHWWEFRPSHPAP